MRRTWVTISARTWATISALAVVLAGMPTGATAGSFDWDRIVGEWEVLVDNNPDSTVETVVVEVSISATDTQGRNIYEGVIADAGYHECLTVGQVVWPALERGRGDGEYLTDAGLSAGCGDEGGRLSVIDDFEVLAYDSNGPGGQWRLLPGSGNGQDPDDIRGLWDDVTTTTGAVIRVEISGAAPSYAGRVVEAAEGSCYAVGQLIWPEITFGRGGTGATFGITDATAGLECTPIETAELRLERTSEPQRLRIVGPGLPGFQLARVDVEDPEETGEDPPAEIQRIAPFSIRGRWIDRSFTPDSPDNDSLHGRIDVSLEEADSSVIATGLVATSRNADACPGEQAVAWTITGERTDGYVGTANIYARTAVGCELVGIEDMRITDASLGQGVGEVDDIRVQIGGRQPASWGREAFLTLVGRARAQDEVALDFLLWGIRRALAAQTGQFAQAQPITLYLATGAAFPDGLAVSSVTGATRGITLLLDPSDQAGNTALVDEALRLLGDAGIGVSELVVAGGEAAVPTGALPTGAGLPPLRRVQGPNRFATAAALSQSAFAGEVDTAYIATGANFPDALAGGAAASVGRAPLLLVDGGRMPDETAAELTRLAPERIVVLGGTAVIPESMVAQLSVFADRVDRLSGDSRFATAAAIAADSFPGGSDLALLVPGGSFQEALVAGSAAWLFDAPLLLADGNGVPAALAEALADLGVSRGFMLAAEDRIPAEVVASLQDVVSGAG